MTTANTPAADAYARRPLDASTSISASVGTRREGGRFVGLLRTRDGGILDASPAHFTTRARARGAAWSEWRKRCNARSEYAHPDQFEGERGWDEAH